MRLSLTFSKRLILFVCVVLLCLILTSVAVGFIGYKAGTDSVKWMRIAAVLQDIMLFILPALITSLLITRLPATFLCVDRSIKPAMLLVAVCALLFATPAMNSLIAWNQNIHFPESMHSLEQAVRSSEEAAAQSVNVLLGDHTVMSLIIGIMIVGILAGFSEELLFRGTFQRLLATAPMNRHCAIWIAAFVFSAVHMQFFGFFPRLLLGAFFGYLLLWSGSLWLPVCLHVLNNTVYICGNWYADGAPAATDTIGASGNLLVNSISILLTAACLVVLYRLRRPNSSGK